MLEMKDVSKIYRKPDGNGVISAVEHVNFQMNEGQFYALVGESGSGKTTLSRLLLGLAAPTSGDVLLDGVSITPHSRRRPRSLCAKMQLVLQDGKGALDPHLSIYDNIAEPIRNLTQLSRAEERKCICGLMEKMELSMEYLKRRPHELSGGEQKRVCIARALAADPEIIIFDEAVSGLDVLVRKSILDLLKRIHQERKGSYLFITHDIDVALYLADHVLVMKDGRIVEQVPYRGDADVFQHPYSRMLLELR